MTLKIIHKNNTSAGQAPASSDLDVGEIGINGADAELYTKDTNGNIRKFQNTTTGTADGVQFTQAGTGAVQRTVESKLQDVVSVKDFGAVGDGVTDDTAAIQAAIDYAETFIIPSTASQSLRNGNNRGIVWFPPGAYKVTSTLIINGPGVHVKGSGVAATIIERWFDDNLFDARSDLETTTGSLHNIAFSDFSARGRIVDPTQGAAIRVGIVKHVYIYNIHFNGFYNDIVLEGTQEPVWVSNCNFFANNNVTTARVGNAHIRAGALEVDAGATNAQRGPDVDGKFYAYCSSIMVSNCEMRTAANFKEFAVYIGACDGFYLQNCHLLNHRDQVMIARGNSLCPCTNIRLQDCFFDGESPNTLRNVRIASNQAQAGSPSDVYISNCKFNGVGGGGVEAWVIANDVALRMLVIEGSFFDKAKNATAAAIELQRGDAICSISNNVFLLEELYVPTTLIRSNASAVAASDIFSHICIDSNKIICSGTADRPNYNIRIANAQNKVAITNNVYYADSGVGGDGLLYDTKTSGTTYGNGTTNNNIDIS